MDIIDAESAGLLSKIESSAGTVDVANREEQFRTAASLLATLRKRLDGVISPEIKRRIVELWVEKVPADTVERWGALENEITISE